MRTSVPSGIGGFVRRYFLAAGCALVASAACHNGVRASHDSVSDRVSPRLTHTRTVLRLRCFILGVREPRRPIGRVGGTFARLTPPGGYCELIYLFSYCVAAAYVKIKHSGVPREQNSSHRVTAGRRLSPRRTAYRANGVRFRCARFTMGN